MHEADDAYSIRYTWSRYWLDQFLTLALNILILSIFYISMNLSTNYFAHFSGCWASFACGCHYPRMLCHVFWSQIEYKIVCFISGCCYWDKTIEISNGSTVLVPHVVSTSLRYHLVKIYEDHCKAFDYKPLSTKALFIEGA